MNNAIDADGNGTGRRARHPALGLPNLLTYARIAALPFFVACFYVPGDAARWTACAIFIVAAITDYLDGYLARVLNQHSALGRMLDPIADKLIVAVALVMLASDGTLAGSGLIAAVIILSREILISGLREFMGGYAIVVPVSRLAKWKTATQLVAIVLLLAGPPAEALVPGTMIAGISMLWLAAILTVVTGYDYMKIGIKRLIEEDRP